jgi:hypothetical protein
VPDQTIAAIQRPTQKRSPQKRPSQKGKFFCIRPDIRGGGKGHGLVIANEDKLALPGRHTISLPNGDPGQYPEKPILLYVRKMGRLPRDMEGLGGIWILSEPLKQAFEAVDPEGFTFVASDFILADGSPAPQRYLCNVVRTLDALDEEASKLKIETSDDYVNGKFYSRAGGASLAFREAIVGSAHIFRTPFSDQVFCDRVLCDALKRAKLTGVWLTDAADC